MRGTKERWAGTARQCAVRTRAALVGTIVTALLAGHAGQVPPAAATEGAPGARLAVLTESALYTADHDGNNLRRIVDLHRRRVRGNGVTWAPRGTALAYTATRCPSILCPDHAGQLRVVKADGSGEREVVSLPSVWLTDPAWSPSGRHIAFVAYRTPPCFCPGAPVVMIVTPQGSQLLTVGPGVNPAWSPSGLRLAYNGLDGRVRVIDLAEPERSTAVSPPHLLANQPSWAPDGTIAFVASPAASPWTPSQVWLVRRDGSRLRQLPLQTDSRVTWSSDGTHLAMLSRNSIVVADAGGSRARRIADHGYGLAWVPHGREVAFHRWSAVHVAGADGSGERTIIPYLAGGPVDLAWTR